MSLYEIKMERWTSGDRTFDLAGVQRALEEGDVLFFPALDFSILPEEHEIFTPSILGGAKNASYDPRTGRLGSASVTGAHADMLRRLMMRFTESAAALARSVLPGYGTALSQARASFRPAEIAGRSTSWRKDDTRLHVDSFPATPSGGRRILRVFTNVNPVGRPRSWRIGGDFEAVAQRFAASLRLPFPGTGRALSLLRITKTPRTAYDALMLQLHDAMKRDDNFQRTAPQTAVEFPAGSTWMAFTDQVGHAAMSGQYQLEQTFLLPVDAMRDPARSPLRILERIKGRRLA